MSDPRRRAAPSVERSLLRYVGSGAGSSGASSALRKGDAGFAKERSDVGPAMFALASGMRIQLPTGAVGVTAQQVDIDRHILALLRAADGAFDGAQPLAQVIARQRAV